MTTGLREYIVTLKDYKDLENFYHDMENSSTVRFVPRRPVGVADRRPVSRNTHYYLYDGEVENLKKDPRVLSVELNLEEQGITVNPVWTQTSSLWNKSNTVSSTHRNWGLLRCFEQVQRTGWGSDSTTNVSGTITTTADGRDVDVVVVDGLINPNHPEFAANADGTGGSRVNQFNWFSLNSQVTGGANGTYTYTPYVDSSYPDNNGDGISDRTADNDHGCHVAGTIVGNTHGWARKANIYNISPYGSSPSVIPISRLVDYIRVWHRNKPVNPRTGLKNPTITNHSYGLSVTANISDITKLRFRGVEYDPPFSDSELTSRGLLVSGTTVQIPIYSASLDADIQDAINEGIVFVAAAGNDGLPLDSFSTTISRDYNNYIERFGSVLTYYSRGTWNNPNVIVVGSVNLLSTERKSTFSSTGRRVDLYAPGERIISSVNSTVYTTVPDSRNGTYRLSKFSGTSMASPQVAGVLACAAEHWPTIKNSTAKEFIINSARLGQLTTTSGGIGDPNDLINGENRYLAFYNPRPLEGQAAPKVNLGPRKTAGQVWPRTNILRYGR